jgi:phosphohistidine phosphatase SixA
VLVLVRHAESHPPTPGGPDELHRGLTPAGLAQAEQLVAELAAPARGVPGIDWEFARTMPMPAVYRL